MKHSRQICYAVVVALGIAFFATPQGFAKRKGKPPPPPSSPPNPEIAYWDVSQNHSYLVVANRDGSNKTSLVASTDSLAYPEFSPTENGIAYSDNGVLRYLRYSVSDTAVTVDSIQTVDATTYCYQSDISRNGDRIVYTAEGGRLLLKSMSNLGGDATPIFGGEGSGYYALNAVWLNSSDRLAISYRHNWVIEIIVASINPNDLTLTFAPSTLPLSLEGLDVSHPNIEASRTSDDLIVSVKMKTGQVWGKGKNKYEVEGHVVHRWSPVLDPTGAAFGPLTDTSGELIVGESPCFSPDDSSIVGYDEYRDAMITTSLDNGSVTPIASGWLRHPDWKRIPTAQ